jgi:hypothetical protein
VTQIRSTYSLIRDHTYRSLAASKPFGGFSYGNADAIMNAIGYADVYSRIHDAVIRVYDNADKVIETYEHAGDFKERSSRAQCSFSRSSCEATLCRAVVNGSISFW